MSAPAKVDEASVLIAGGGLVGLSTALFLAQHGVRSLVIEKRRGGSILPRAAHFHLRTLELFRLAGIEDEVKRRSSVEFVPEGPIVDMENLGGKKHGDIIGSLNEGVEILSPCRRLFIKQSSLEPILRRQVKRKGTHVLDGHEIVDIRQDSSSASVIARDVHSGAERLLRGQYLVAADGAHSIVRDWLGIPLEGRSVFSNSITIYFKADISRYVGDNSFSVAYVNNADLGGIFRLSRRLKSGFLIVNRVGNPLKDPDATNPAKEVGEARLKQLVRCGIGVADLPVKILAVARWHATAEVAARFGHGRIFLAGDAAHLMPPNGGFGGNTGIQDAHNLAWKLALALKQVSPPTLLETYETERRPIACLTAEQAYTRYVLRTAPYLGVNGVQAIVPDLNLELGYLYDSPAILSEADGAQLHDDPHRTCGRPGSRAPHLWLEQEGRRISTLDLFGRSPVLITGPGGGAWCEAARNHRNLDVACYRIGVDVDDLSTRFGQAYGLSAGGASLVRPDGFVAWRAPLMASDPERALKHALSSFLMC
ncbi:MAG TPA: FAD-dependent monooxygenase [Stellaceae bacterium]|nr:FAD-dependent monooxygenase [Stellaceae bacterium]